MASETPDGAAISATPSAAATSDPFAAVDADLAALEDLPAADQVPVLDRIHRTLTATLATSGAGQAGSPSGAASGGG